MGWLISSRWQNKEDLRYHLTERNGIKTIRSCWTGNNLWAVHEYTYQEGEKAGQTVRFIGLYLCRFYKDEGGYKDMDESAGPCYYNCPLSYIELVEAHEKAHGYEPSGYAAEWRKSVREALAKKKRKFAPGTKIMLYGTEYEVLAQPYADGSYPIRMTAYGGVFRMPKRQIRDVEVVS